MTKSNEQYEYFSITGDFDPLEITRILGVHPTEAWKIGDLHPKNGMERKCSSWSLFSRKNHSEDLEKHIQDVLDQMEVNMEGFKDITSKFEGTMQLVAYWHNSYTGLHLDPDITKALGWYGLAIDHDFYYLFSDRREDVE